ncbi:hypothetical protein GN244_ATG08039 [Phytophthora infestans]|uniref:Uncharacterized protein n=1 Tax=Phytophthora infestans TaxID=4787 RepID=A0A833W2G4_PHYIN|nr:hypothetical protein GN244_ATG08039 [Phytophthora infestans]
MVRCRSIESSKRTDRYAGAGYQRPSAVSYGRITRNFREIAAETIYSMLQDSSSVLDTSQKEELQRMTITFPTYDYVVTLDAEQVYVVKRSSVQE